MKKVLAFLAQSEAACYILVLIACLFASDALGDDSKCKEPYKKDPRYNNECVTLIKESCTHSCYRHTCGYGFYYGKYKYGCGYGYDHSCPGKKDIVKRADGVILNRGMCR